MTHFSPLTEEWIRAQDVSDLELARNAVTAVGIEKVALDRDKVTRISATTEVKLDSLSVTNQKRSGRCWAFAALNVARHELARTLGLDSFEFSQAFIQYYDKVEKARRTLAALEAAQGDERLTDFLYAHGISDGGWWNYYVNLITTYGMVPQNVMPESESSSNTAALDAALGHVIRRGGSMEDAHRVIATHLGIPPRRFRFTYRDKDGDYHDEGEMTPQEFAARYLPNLDDYVHVGHDPRHPAGVNVAVDQSTNMIGTAPSTFFNVDCDDLLRTAEASVRAGDPVWFACDVNRQFSREYGLWDRDLYNYELVYGVSAPTSRAERLSSYESVPTHGMVLTGVDNDRFRVENSWGTKLQDQTTVPGYGTMTFDWFRDNAHTIVVKREHAPEFAAAAQDAQTIVLPYFDPMA